MQTMNAMSRASLVASPSGSTMRARRRAVAPAAGHAKDRRAAPPLGIRCGLSTGRAPTLRSKPRTYTPASTVTRALGGSFDETDPVPAGAVAKTEAGEETEQVGNMAEVAAWVGAAVVFGLGIGAVQGAGKAEEFFAGYLLEQSLSVDNLFVFVLVFDYFKVPLASQPRVLNYGIWGAMVMRAAMIIAGYEAVTNFKPILLVFAGVLIFSSYKLIAEGDEEEEEDMSENAIVKFCSGLLPVSTEYDGDNFFTMENGAKIATPLLLCLCVIELSDVVFAVDSIPAVFGITEDPLIVYSSNIFAIMGLRSLFAFVATMVAELEYCKPRSRRCWVLSGARWWRSLAARRFPRRRRWRWSSGCSARVWRFRSQRRTKTRRPRGRATRDGCQSTRAVEIIFFLPTHTCLS